MTNNNNKLPQHKFIIVALIGLAALSRLMPHPPNFTALGAMALFGSAYIARPYLALIIPLAALWISNLLINNIIYAEFSQGFTWFSTFDIFVFSSFALIVLMGRNLLKTKSVSRIFGASLGASTLFFVISNFGTWLSSGMYPRTLEGLIACYTAAIPFFGSTITGDLFFCTALFGSYYLINKNASQIVLQ